MRRIDSAASEAIRYQKSLQPLPTQAAQRGATDFAQVPIRFIDVKVKEDKTCLLCRKEAAQGKWQLCDACRARNAARVRKAADGLLVCRCVNCRCKRHGAKGAYCDGCKRRLVGADR